MSEKTYNRTNGMDYLMKQLHPYFAPESWKTVPVTVSADALLWVLEAGLAELERREQDPDYPDIAVGWIADSMEKCMDATVAALGPIIVANCEHPSGDGTGNEDEYQCNLCGTVYRYVDDPIGPISGGPDGKRQRRETVRVGEGVLRQSEAELTPDGDLPF